MFYYTVLIAFNLIQKQQCKRGSNLKMVRPSTDQFHDSKRVHLISTFDRIFHLFDDILYE